MVIKKMFFAGLLLSAAFQVAASDIQQMVPVVGMHQFYDGADDESPMGQPRGIVIRTPSGNRAAAALQARIAETVSNQVAVHDGNAIEVEGVDLEEVRRPSNITTVAKFAAFCAVPHVVASPPVQNALSTVVNSAGSACGKLSDATRSAIQPLVQNMSYTQMGTLAALSGMTICGYKKRAALANGISTVCSSVKSGCSSALSVLCSLPTAKQRLENFVETTWNAELDKRVVAPENANVEFNTQKAQDGFKANTVYALSAAMPIFTEVGFYFARLIFKRTALNTSVFGAFGLVNSLGLYAATLAGATCAWKASSKVMNSIQDEDARNRCQLISNGTVALASIPALYHFFYFSRDGLEAKCARLQGENDLLTFQLKNSTEGGKSVLKALGK